MEGTSGFVYYCQAMGLNSADAHDMAEMCDAIIEILRKNELSYKEAEQVLECTKVRMSDIRI